MPYFNYLISHPRHCSRTRPSLIQLSVSTTDGSSDKPKLWISKQELNLINLVLDDQSIRITGVTIHCYLEPLSRQYYDTILLQH